MSATLDRSTFHFIVRYLVVPYPWTVGEVTFRPAALLREELPAGAIRDDARMGWAWTDAAVTVPVEWRAIRTGAGVSGRVVADEAIDRARAVVHDSLAVLRLYQRSVMPGFRRLGSLFDCSFHAGHVRGFGQDPAFVYLDQAMIEANTEWQRRAVAAVRTLGHALPLLRQPQRIVQQATALEALLGEPGTYGKAHDIARRAAFVTCPQDGARLAAPASACVNLTASSATRLAKDPRVSGRPAGDWDWPCVHYWHVREVYDARNAALHDAVDAFPAGTAVRFEGLVDQVILNVVAWVAATGATGLADLSAAIAKLPRRPEPAGSVARANGAARS